MKNHTKIIQVITIQIKLWLKQKLNGGFLIIYDGTRYLMLVRPFLLSRKNQI